jgi:glycosyltransferase involved in cell wall biosynthesis
MQDFGLVSIITASYNCSKFIAETIESIQAQTYTHWELLITDDCSTDSSREVIRKYAEHDSRIRLICLPENSGAGVARNKSIEQAQGRYIAFCDSDDCWLPYKLEKQLDFMNRNNVDACYSSYLTCDEQGDIRGIVVAYKSINYKEICRDDSIGFLTFIYNVEHVGKVYMPSLRKRQDWAYKILLMQKAPQAFGVLDALAIYRIRTNSLSNNKRKLVRYNVRVYKEVLHYSTIGAWLKFLFDFFPHYVAKKLRLRIINQ